MVSNVGCNTPSACMTNHIFLNTFYFLSKIWSNNKEVYKLIIFAIKQWKLSAKAVVVTFLTKDCSITVLAMLMSFSVSVAIMIASALNALGHFNEPQQNPVINARRHVLKDAISKLGYLHNSAMTVQEKHM